MSPHTAVDILLLRLRNWWQTLGERKSIDRQELGRIARELGMTADDLEDIVARGPDAANLLYERMRLLGITRADVQRSARGLMLDLERTCAFCKGKRICEKDLINNPADPNWRNYCPNAMSLEALIRLKDQATA